MLKVIRVLLWFSFARAVFNIACHWSKTKTKLIALTNHSGRKQHRNQLELEAKTCDGGQAWEFKSIVTCLHAFSRKTRASKSRLIGLTSDWLRKLWELF